MHDDSEDSFTSLPTEWYGIFERTAAFVHRHIVPLYLLSDEKLSLDRTGVLFQVAGHKFIVTAAHGLRNLNPKEFIPCFATSSKTRLPIPLSEAKLYVTECEAIKSVRDLAAIRLTDPQIECLPDFWQFLSMPDIGHDSRIDEGLYFAMGYPSDIRWYSQEKWSEPNTLPYISRVVFPESSSVFDPNVHMSLDFDRSCVHLNTEENEGLPEMLPKIHGMSGCGIWKVVPPGLSIDRWDINHVRLVGIQHRCKHDEYILGTQIRWLLHRLVADFPDIESAIKISYRSGY